MYEDGTVLSTAQLDCRLLEGEIVVAHVKRECHMLCISSACVGRVGCLSIEPAGWPAGRLLLPDRVCLESFWKRHTHGRAPLTPSRPH